MNQIACTNCGAKYKLPDTFKSDKAKCKACGSVIDVAAQRANDGGTAGAKPSSAKPAAAKPAKAKPASTRRRAAAGGETSEKPRRARASARGADADGADDKPKRRGRTRGAGRTSRTAESKGGNKGMMIGGSIVGIALLVVGAIYFLSGGDDAPPATNDDKTASAKDQPAEPNDAAPATEANADDAAADTTEADAAKSDDAQPAEGAAEKPKPTAKPTPPAKKPSKDPQTKEEVFNPMRDLAELEWPADIADQAEAMREHVQGVVDGGFPAQRHKDALLEAGRPAVFAIVNHLRKTDFFDLYQTLDAFEFTKVLRKMTFESFPVAFDMTNEEDIPLTTAHKNAMSVRDWHKMATRYAEDPDEWAKFIAKAEEIAKKKAEK